MSARRTRRGGPISAEVRSRPGGVADARLRLRLQVRNDLAPRRRTAARAERWPSGRRHQIANLAYWVTGTEGSNPSLSARKSPLARPICAPAMLLRPVCRSRRLPPYSRRARTAHGVVACFVAKAGERQRFARERARGSPRKLVSGRGGPSLDRQKILSPRARRSLVTRAIPRAPVRRARSTSRGRGRVDKPSADFHNCEPIADRR